MSPTKYLEPTEENFEEWKAWWDPVVKRIGYQYSHPATIFNNIFQREQDTIWEIYDKHKHDHTHPIHLYRTQWLEWSKLNYFDVGVSPEDYRRQVSIPHPHNEVSPPPPKPQKKRKAAPTASLF